MVEPILITLPPTVFLIVLFAHGAAFRRRNMDIDGKPPINKPLFVSSKYLIVLVWAAMVAGSWGLGFSLLDRPLWLKSIALCLWFGGFAVMAAGRMGMGDSFRIGSAKEDTALRTSGLFRFSRNPMYVGVYSTLLGSVLYTLNPAVLVAAVYIVAVHHAIVLAEERHLRGVFGSEYSDYCTRVRRYL